MVKLRIAATAPRDLATCTIVEAELRFGALKAVDPNAQVVRVEGFLSALTILPFDSDAAREYARLRAHLERAGTPIGPNDLMIAFIALSRNLTLVPHNLTEFARVPGLFVQDWEA